MSINPYESPQTPPEPPKPLPVNKARAWRWLGTFLIVFAVIPYVPMTISPFAAIVTGNGTEPAWLLALAGVFNGCVCCLLFFGGRWMRKKAMMQPAAPREFE